MFLVYLSKKQFNELWLEYLSWWLFILNTVIIDSFMLIKINNKNTNKICSCFICSAIKTISYWCCRLSLIFPMPK